MVQAPTMNTKAATCASAPEKEVFNMDITTFPVTVPPKKPVVEAIVEPSEIDPKLLAIMRKYKYNWRLTQLSKPPLLKRTPKFVPEPVRLIQATPKKEFELDREVEYRCDHLSRVPLRTLMETKKVHRKRGKKFNTIMDKHIKKSWRSIYNFYKYVTMKRKARKKTVASKTSKKSVKSKADVQKEKDERYTRLAQPKRVPSLPPLPKKKFKPLEQMKEHIDVLAAPKEYDIPEMKVLGKVNSQALVYEITDAVKKLASAIPKRYTEKIEMIIPGKVKPSALRAKITERIEKMAVPKTTRETKQAADDDDDMWKISPNALKYKPTPRILELAKPLERS